MYASHIHVHRNIAHVNKYKIQVVFCTLSGHQLPVRSGSPRGGRSGEVEPPQTHRTQSPLHGRLQTAVVSQGTLHSLYGVSVDSIAK